ncbi:MAG: helix-turn-helix domain-containing protein [Anaerolineaceae bacterium]|nr:helix-turn-helix domain-containing protein [Anaerolineaceae bacterium]
MSENKTATLQMILQLALPPGTALVTGHLDTEITWAVTVRARPPAFSEIYGGELALVSIRLLQAVDNRITLIDVIKGLSDVGVRAIACPDELPDEAIHAARKYEISLLVLPEDTSLTRVEREVNATIANYAAQVSQRVLEIQRQLTRLVMENRDIASLLHVLARATTRLMLLHDTTGTLIAQCYPDLAQQQDHRTSLAYGAFQNWLERFSPEDASGDIAASPLGYTAMLRVEKRPAGYLTVSGKSAGLDDFTRMVLIHGADACALEMAKSRAVKMAVEQARGDWIQMWLSGVSNDYDPMTTRAHQSGFPVEESYFAAVYQATTASGSVFTLENQVSLVRDLQTRSHINGAVGHYVDMIVALYTFDGSALERLRGIINTTREQLMARLPGSTVTVGISSPAAGLAGLRDAYREARDAIYIAQELGTTDTITFYGDLQLFRLLLALKETAHQPLRHFHDEALGKLIEYDLRKDAMLLKTLESYFQANGNLAKAASELAIHRNTLIYRLERITEMTGINLDDADTRLILHLALKIQRVLGIMPD